MARPTLNPDDRRKQIAVRFGPDERIRLEELANEASKAGGKEVSVGKLVETRIAAMLSADAKTFELLAEIAAEIAEIESLGGGAAWHDDLTLWGSVAEMLSRGPIDSRRPEIVAFDGAYQFAQREKAQAIMKKQAVIDRLAVLGISASIEPAGQRRGKGGLFGGLLSHYIDRRANEQELIDGIADNDTRSRAQALHDELRQLDKVEADEDGEMTDAAKIYRDMEEVGRGQYRRQRLAKLIAMAASYSGRLPTKAG